MKPDLTILKDNYGIFRSENISEVPDWIESPDFYSFTKTKDEISIVCKQSAIGHAEKGSLDENWKIIKVVGPLDLSLTGIIAGITGLLGRSKIPVFTVSTYITDYILVKEEYLERAIAALINKSYKILFEK